MAFRVAGIGSGFETILPLVDSATLALKRLSDSPMDILHSQLNSGAHRRFGHCTRLLKSIVLKRHIKGLTRRFITFQSRILLDDRVKFAEI